MYAYIIISHPHYIIPVPSPVLGEIPHVLTFGSSAPAFFVSSDRSSSEIFSVERCSPEPWVMESLAKISSDFRDLQGVAAMEVSI